MKKYLVLSGIGPDRKGIVKALGAAAFGANCSIEDSRMARLGGEFAILVLVEGDENDILKFKAQVPELENETGLSISIKDTSSDSAACVPDSIVPFRVTVVGMDRTGIVFRVTELFARHGANVENLETSSEYAPVSGTPIFRMELETGVPTDVSVRHLREELGMLCDELNVDYTLEAL